MRIFGLKSDNLHLQNDIRMAGRQADIYIYIYEKSTVQLARVLTQPHPNNLPSRIPLKNLVSVFVQLEIFI